MDAVSVALLISIVGNVVQMIFNFCRICTQTNKCMNEARENKQRESYNDLDGGIDGGAIYF